MNYGIDDTDLVYNQGVNIHGMGDQAFTTANNAIQAIVDAKDVVHHPLLAGAIGGFYDSHCRDAHSLMYSVQDCGSGVADTSCIVVNNENESTAVQQVAATQAEQTHGHLNFEL